MKELFGTRFRDVSHFVDSKKLPPNGPAGSLGDTVVHLLCRDLRLGNIVSVFDNIEDAWNSATYGGAYHLVNEDPQKVVLISNDGRNLDIIHGNIDPDVDMAGEFVLNHLAYGDGFLFQHQLITRTALLSQNRDHFCWLNLAYHKLPCIGLDLFILSRHSFFDAYDVAFI